MIQKLIKLIIIVLVFGSCLPSKYYRNGNYYKKCGHIPKPIFKNDKFGYYN